jgi:hypothetical protein
VPRTEGLVPGRRRFLTTPDYAPRIRAPLSIALVLAAVAAVSGCNSGGNSSTQGEPPGGTTSVMEPTTTAQTTDPLAGAGTGIVVSTSTAKTTALLNRVAVGQHEGFDRVVFQFQGEGIPGYRIEYVDGPLKEDGSGAPVTLAGNAFLVVRMEPASGFDLNTGEGKLIYKGPRRLPGGSVVKEVVRTGDFEAVLTWAVGLDSKTPFRVTTTSSPSRLIVDLRSV